MLLQTAMPKVLMNRDYDNTIVYDKELWKFSDKFS